MQATINHKNGNSLLWRPSPVFTAAVIFRILLLVWGDFQDARSPVKYTDIDYNVFTDASQFLAAGKSPYERATYRYTPLLAWLLLPTTSSSIPYAFAFGKIVFALSDIFAGWLILSILTSQGMPSGRALQFASIWLLNPMVANISTRGSSEGLLAVVVLGVLWSTLRGHHIIAGSLLGIAVHLKIYPFVYGLALFWSLRGASNGAKQRNAWFISWRGVEILNEKQLWLAVSSVSAFMGLNIVMYQIYGHDFLQHTYLYHLTRLDHRHNYSPYNVLLYLKSSPSASSHLSIESLAFLPQIGLAAVVVPLMLARKDLASCMLVQTMTFVAFNKVCTAQYFMWFMVFLPFYLPKSSLLKQPMKGFTILGLWVLAQAMWLQQAFSLEHLAKSTFVPGLWSASLLLFMANVILLGIFIEDIGNFNHS